MLTIAGGGGGPLGEQHARVGKSRSSLHCGRENRRASSFRNSGCVLETPRWDAEFWKLPLETPIWEADFWKLLCGTWPKLLFPNGENLEREL